MAFGTRVAFEDLRTVAFGDISGSYVPIGGAFTQRARIVTINNDTNVNLLISTDGSNDKIRVPSNGFKLYDFSSNKVRDDGLFFDIGTQLYVKEDASSPTTGSLWVEVVYGSGGI